MSLASFLTSSSLLPATKTAQMAYVIGCSVALLMPFAYLEWAFLSFFLFFFLTLLFHFYLFYFFYTHTHTHTHTFFFSHDPLSCSITSGVGFSFYWQSSHNSDKLKCLLSGCSFSQTDLSFPSCRLCSTAVEVGCGAIPSGFSS